MAQAINGARSSVFKQFQCGRRAIHIQPMERHSNGSFSSSSSRQSWADQSEEADCGASAALAQACMPAEEVPGVCLAWQQGSCPSGSSCFFLHDLIPQSAVAEHGNISSSWSGPSQPQDGSSPAAIADSGGQTSAEPAQGSSEEPYSSSYPNSTA